MKNWEIKKLSEICEIMNGGTPDTTIPKFWDGENLWITPKDMGKLESIYVDDTLRKITSEGLKNSSAKILPTNSIILSSRAPIGHLAINTKPISTNQGCKGLIPKKGIDTLFLYYFLSKSVELLNSLGTGTTFKELSGSKLGTVEIPLPPLPEQQRIVAILDEAFAAIAKAKANAEQNLKNAKELFESYLQGVFENGGEGWEEKTLREVCEFDKNSNKRENLTYVGLEDIQSNTGKFIGPFEPRSVKSLTFYFNDEHVLYGRLRPYLNKVLLPDFEGHCSTEIFPIKPKKNVLDRGFLFQWLIATETMKKINETWTGATLPRANMNTVLEFKINLPSFNEQKTIVQKFDALSTETKKLEAIYHQKINDLEELKKSILQKAFSGELKVSEPLIDTD
ncbi:MAG: restriction endonuclease subunit S [Flavobacterium sp.]|nr:restriction endonuclease subunit S [Flavobacterium sp.]